MDRQTGRCWEQLGFRGRWDPDPKFCRKVSVSGLQAGLRSHTGLFRVVANLPSSFGRRERLIFPS